MLFGMLYTSVILPRLMIFVILTLLVLSVCSDYNRLQFYHSGVSDPLYCPGDLYSLDHAVLLVGFGTRKNMLGHEQKYWIIKNSWGESWGMKGYFELARGKSKCGVNQLVSFPKVK